MITVNPKVYHFLQLYIRSSPGLTQSFLLTVLLSVHLERSSGLPYVGFYCCSEASHLLASHLLAFENRRFVAHAHRFQGKLILLKQIVKAVVY